MELLASAALAELFSHWVWPVFLFVFGFGTVVFVHELGHFIVAKLAGITVERFAIGFGPRVCGIKFRGTDYSLMLLPLGGYVKMVGQEDFAPNEDTKDPGAYCNKSIGARFAVIAAGVTMNVIFAAVILIGLGMYGMRFPAPVIGGIAEKSPSNQAQIIWEDDLGPAESVGLMPGDKVVKIKSDTLLSKSVGGDIEKFSKIAMLGVLSDVDDKYEFTIQREIDGKVRTGKATVGLYMAPSITGSGSQMPQFGLIPASSLEIADVSDDTIIADDNLRGGDVLTAVNGIPVKASWKLEPIIKGVLGKTAVLTVERGGQTIDVTCPTAFVRGENIFWLADGSVIRGSYESTDKDGNYTFALKDGSKKQVAADKIAPDAVTVMGMIPRLAVMGVMKKSPAQSAGILPGDVIISYGDTPNPTISKVHELNKKFAAAVSPITVLRGGEIKELSIIPKKNNDSAQIGIVTSVDYSHIVLANVYEGSPAREAGFLPGDEITAVNGTPVKSWPELLDVLSGLENSPVDFTVKRGTSVAELSLTKLTGEIFSLNDYQTQLFRTGRDFNPLMTPRLSRGPVAAMGWGVRETFVFLATQYATFRSLFAGTVSTKELTGPVGIGNMAIQAGRRGFSQFAYFMAMISVALAVVNFLPIPVVDGGHALFLILEKIMGKPLPLKVMNVIQVIGLVLIGAAFIAITYQDIMRWF